MLNFAVSISVSVLALPCKCNCEKKLAEAARLKVCSARLTADRQTETFDKKAQQKGGEGCVCVPGETEWANARKHT